MAIRIFRRFNLRGRDWCLPFIANAIAGETCSLECLELQFEFEVRCRGRFQEYSTQESLTAY